MSQQTAGIKWGMRAFALAVIPITVLAGVSIFDNMRVHTYIRTYIDTYIHTHSCVHHVPICVCD
jgi:hypothetical protein